MTHWLKAHIHHCTVSLFGGLLLLYSGLGSATVNTATYLSQTQQLLSTLESKSEAPALENIPPAQLSNVVTHQLLLITLESFNLLQQTANIGTRIYLPRFNPEQPITVTIKPIAPVLFEQTLSLVQQQQQDIHYSSKTLDDWNRATLLQNLLKLMSMLQSLSGNEGLVDLMDTTQLLAQLQGETEDLLLNISKRLPDTDIQQKRHLITALYGYTTQGSALFNDEKTTEPENTPALDITEEYAPPDDENSPQASTESAPQEMQQPQLTEADVTQATLIEQLNTIQQVLFDIASQQNINLGHEPFIVDTTDNNPLSRYVLLFSITADLTRLKQSLNITTASQYHIPSNPQSLYSHYLQLYKSHYFLQLVQSTLHRQ